MKLPTKLNINFPKLKLYLLGQNLSRKQVLLAVIPVAVFISLAIVLIGVTHTPNIAQSLSRAGLYGSAGKVAGKAVIGHSADPSVATGQSSTSPSPTGSPKPLAASGQISKTGGDVLGAKTYTDAGTNAPYLVMSPSVIVIGDTSSPHLTMSDRREFSQPADDYTSSPDLSLGWFDDGQGHYAPGDYYLGWKPLIMRKNTDHDGQQVFNITVKDRAGNSYRTTFKVVYFANRTLEMQATSIDKNVVGNNVVYTGHITFNLSSNFGNPVVHLTSNGFYNFGPNPCTISNTDTTFTYTGQPGYDIICSLPQANLSGYQGGFDIYVNARVTWPVQTELNFITKFHAN